MAQKIEIIITADGKKVKAEVTDVTKGVKGLGDASKQADTSTGGFGKSVLSLQTALSALGLGAVVSQVGSFVTESFKAAAAAERLGAATNSLAEAIGSTGDQMVSAITSASMETISKTDAMTAANKAMMFGLVENSDQMARLTEVAITLGAAMGQDAGKSLDDLTTALGRQSPMILDNLGITLKLEEAYRIYAAQLGKTADQLTEQEKKQAFVNAALIKGEERVRELGGVTLDTAGKSEQLSAAWADFTVAFGSLLTQMSGGIETVTSFVRKLEEGAEAWKWVFEARTAIRAYHEEMQTAEIATQAGIEATMAADDAFLAMTNTTRQEVEALQADAEAKREAEHWSNIYAESMRGIAEAQTVEVEAIQVTNEALQSSAELHAMTGVAAAESYREIGEAAMEAAEEARAAQMTLAGSQADFILSFQELQKNMLADEEAFNEQMAGVRSDAATKSKEAAAGLAEELAAIEQDRVDKIKWVRDGAWARTETEEAEAEAYWNAHYEELKNTAVAKTKEKTDAILAEESRATAAQQAAREREKEEYKAHLEELKLQTALSMLETTGQLEQLTGLVGISASDAANLITSGVLPMSQEMGLALQGTMENMESSMAAASETADANQAILQEAFAGTLTGAQNLGTGTTEALLAMGESTTALHQEQTVPYREELELITAETVPALTNIYVSGMDASVAATDRLIAKLPQLETALNKVKTVAAQMTDSITSGMNEAASGIDRAAGKIKSKLIPAIHKTITEMEKLQSIAARTIETLAGAGNMASSATGGAAGFQHGTPPGGFLVPSSFGTDEFLARFSGGERIFAYPNDRTPTNQRNVTNNFYQTINTARYDSGMAAADLRTAQIILGA